MTIIIGNIEIHFENMGSDKAALQRLTVKIAHSLEGKLEDMDMTNNRRSKTIDRIEVPPICLRNSMSESEVVETCASAIFIQIYGELFT